MTTQLDTTHRCDRCGAQAYVELILDGSMGILMFCGSHWDQNKTVLETMGEANTAPLEAMRKQVQEEARV